MCVCVCVCVNSEVILIYLSGSKLNTFSACFSLHGLFQQSLAEMKGWSGFLEHLPSRAASADVPVVFAMFLLSEPSCLVSCQACSLGRPSCLDSRTSLLLWFWFDIARICPRWLSCSCNWSPGNQLLPGFVEISSPPASALVNSPSVAQTQSITPPPGCVDVRPSANHSAACLLSSASNHNCCCCSCLQLVSSSPGFLQRFYDSTAGYV